MKRPHIKSYGNYIIIFILAYMGLCKFPFELAQVMIVYLAWLLTKKLNRGYIAILFFFPLLSLIFMVREITVLNLDFYQYIYILLLTALAFVSVWILAVLHGDKNKVDLSMNVLCGFILIFFMLFMALIEVLPTEILEYFLRSLIIKGSIYDIWSRPPYQLAHFIVMAVSFPFFASFIVSKLLIKFKLQKLIDTNPPTA